MEFINAGDAPAPPTRSSHVVRNRSTVYLAGCVGDDPRSGRIVAGGIAHQTEQAVKNVQACLRAADSDLRHVIRRRLYLVDLRADLQLVESIWAKYVEAPYAVTTAVQVGALAKEGALVEIEVTAAIAPEK